MLCVLRPTLLLENYQPWLDLKVHSKVDASIAEVISRSVYLENAEQRILRTQSMVTVC